MIRRIGNRIRPSGTSQRERTLAAQSAAHVGIDERELADYLDYARKYAEQVAYWEADSGTLTHTGTWMEFFQNDTVLAAQISRDDLVLLRKTFRDKVTTLVDGGYAKTDFRDLLLTLVNMFKTVNDWYEAADADGMLRKVLYETFRVQLVPSLRELRRYDEIGYHELGSSGNDPLSNFVYANTFEATLWNTSATNDTTDVTTYGPLLYGTGTNAQKIEFALSGVEAIFDSLVFVREIMAIEAGNELQRMLTENSDHEPHMALLLAFLDLFKYAREQVNTIPERHLEFYYRQVLQLDERDQVPDQVHLLLKLATAIDQKLIDEGTRFAAGTDALGNNVFYVAETETVLNKATVEKVARSLPDLDKFGAVRRMVVNKPQPVTDPFEADPTRGKGWKLLGGSQYNRAGQVISTRTMDDAEIGFGICSPVLWMNEGERIVKVTINLSYDAAFDLSQKIQDLEDNLKFYFSGEDAWFEASLFDGVAAAAGTGGTPKVDYSDYNTTHKLAVVVDTANSKQTLTVLLRVTSDQPGIIHLDDTKMKDQLLTEWPVLKVVLSADAGELYRDLLSLTVKSYKVDVDVKGVKQLLLQNDLYTGDNSGIFQPFGSVPRPGSQFFIGSAEVFSKKLNFLDIKLTWNNVPAKQLPSYYDLYRTVKVDTAENPTLLSDGITQVYRWYNYLDNIVKSNNDFTARLHILHDGKWYDLERHAEFVPLDDMDEWPEVAYTSQRYSALDNLEAQNEVSGAIWFGGGSDGA